MRKVLNLIKKSGERVDVVLKELNLRYIDKIVELNNIVLDGIEDKQLYAPTAREDFIKCINCNGKIIGCLTKEDELIAMGVYVKNGYEKNNYGYDLGLEGEELLRVGQIESTVVREDFRGNGLQKIICEILEGIGRNENTTIMTSTASPYNEFSVNTFKSLGYEIKKDKIKYGGLRRYVFAKELK